MGVSIHQDDYAKLAEKAKNKKDGVWKWRGYLYAVKGARLVLVGEERSGEVAACSGAFLVSLGQREPSRLKQLMLNSL